MLGYSVLLLSLLEGADAQTGWWIKQWQLRWLLPSAARSAPSLGNYCPPAAGTTERFVTPISDCQTSCEPQLTPVRQPVNSCEAPSHAGHAGERPRKGKRGAWASQRAAAHGAFPPIFGNTNVPSSGDPLSHATPWAKKWQNVKWQRRERVPSLFSGFLVFRLVGFFALLQLHFRDSIKMRSALTKLSSSEVYCIFLLTLRRETLL